MIENIPALKIESNDDETVTLEQEWSGNVDRVTVHALHLRFMAERLGLVREVSASEADMVRTVTTLRRRLRALHDRIKHLDECLWTVQGYGREDLDHECTFVSATLDLAVEFTTDLDQLAPAHASAEARAKPTGNPNTTQRVPAGSEQLALDA